LLFCRLTCSCCKDILAEFQPVRKLLHSKRWQHVAQRVMDVRTQLPVCLPIQHTKQHTFQTGLCDVQIWTIHQINTVRGTVSHRGELNNDLWFVLINLFMICSHEQVYEVYLFSLILVLSLPSPALFARLMAYSQTSAASLWASCLRQATAARRSNRWELHRCTCRNPTVQWEIMTKINTNYDYQTCRLKLISYTETGHQAGQVDMAGSEHMQLLQTWDGSCLHKGVRVVLHDGTTNQAGGADGGNGGSVS